MSVTLLVGQTGAARGALPARNDNGSGAFAPGQLWSPPCTNIDNGTLFVTAAASSLRRGNFAESGQDSAFAMAAERTTASK